MAGFKPFRRTAIVAAATGAAVVATALTGPVQAGTPATTSSAGLASASAQSYRLDPRTAALSLGIGFGVSLAGYTNNVAQAESRGIDLGIIGSTLSAEGCDGGDPTLPSERQPQPLRADSRDKDSSQLKTENEKYVAAISKAVRADSTPFAEAWTTTAGLSGSGSLVRLDGVISRATTRLNNGSREAIATSEVGSFGIGGIVELSGMKWVAESRTGAVDENKGSFQIGALKVLGQRLPVNNALKAIENANTLLAPLGLRITYPEVRVAAGIQFVDPLKISVVPSNVRDTLLATVLGQLRPLQKNLYDIILEQDCGNDTYILVSDIILGSVTGAGSLSIELGGVNAKSEELKTSKFLEGLPPIASSTNNDTDLGGFTAFDSNTTLGQAPSTPSTAVVGGNPSTRRPTLAAASEKGSRGGKMALVGLIGLAGMLLFAERDRRLMRRAQRLVTEA